MKTKRKGPKPTQPQQPTLDPLSPEGLQQAQATHFRALEAWSLSQPAVVCGVPVLWSLNYDTQQAINQQYLNRLLSQQSDQAQLANAPTDSGPAD